MRLAAAATVALLLTACGGGETDGAEDANVAVPVPASPVPTPLTPATTLPAGDGISGVSAPPPSSPVAEDGAAAAKAVLEGYFAALSAGRYGDGYALWGDAGRASGMDADAFAASFAKFASYDAVIGTPGRIDAGAGQRYVTIPVRVTGQLRDGGRFAFEGPVVLHRTGDIDGATVEQRSWRLSDSGLKPRPAG